MLTFISILLTILIVLIGYFLKEMPKMFRDALLEDQKFGDNRQLQIESYFRQVSGQELQEVMNHWGDMYTDIKSAMDSMGKDDSTFTYTDLQQQTILLGSDKTVRYLAAFQQHIYLHEQPNDEEAAKATVYIAYIVSSLKYDFSGYKIDPLDMMKIRILDYNEMHKLYESAARKIEREVPWK